MGRESLDDIAGGGVVSMSTLSNRAMVACVLVALAAGGASAIAACSSSSSGDSSKDGGTQGSTGDDGPTSVRSDAGPGTVSTQPGSCTNPTVPLIFAPMYSAFIPGSASHSFSVPAVTADGNPATWSLSDPSQANLQLQSFQSGADLVPGVLITMAGTGNDAGQVTVIATESGGACGTSVLTITQNTVDDWMVGSARYNNGTALVPFMFDGSFPDGSFPEGGFEFDGNFPDGGFPFDGSFFPSADAASIAEVDGGTACTNCHGPTATNGPFKTVSHTPEQTGGFSDTDLANIILNGQVPDGGYFDPTVLVPNCDGGPTCTAQALGIWHYFHRWSDITPAELPGVICYLRSLTPQSQTGMSNFGGFFRRDASAP
jgi:hypothetical protein